MGSAYWGNQLLFWELIDKNCKEKYGKFFLEAFDARFESIKFSKKYTVLVDSSDEFISSILDNENSFTSDEKKTIKRYFAYLSFLPLFLSNFRKLPNCSRSDR